MITSDQVTELSYALGDRFEKITIKYLELICKQIKDIGTLDGDNIDRLVQLRKASANMEELTDYINNVLAQTGKDINDLYSSIAKQNYDRFKEVMTSSSIPFEENIRLQNLIKSTAANTNASFINIANTTVISQNYQTVLDEAIQSMSLGLASRDDVLKDLVQKALTTSKVTYASGLTRRLDSAVRMNLREGIHRLYQDSNILIGKEFGANGVEISVHALSAPDHVDIQGKQYTNEEFNNLQNTLARPIGRLNCGHFAIPIIIGVNTPTYSKERLEEFKKNSEKEVEINGKKYTKYQCTQLMRNAETKLRYMQEEYVALDSVGFIDGLDEYKQRIDRAVTQYRKLAKQSGLKARYDRLKVPGYDIVK